MLKDIFCKVIFLYWKNWNTDDQRFKRDLFCQRRSPRLNKAVLEPRVSPAFASTYFCNRCNIRFENTSKYVDTLILFSNNLNQRSLTPTWPLTPCLLRSHVWLYRKDHCVQVPWQYINVCGYSDQFCKLPHTHTTYLLYIHTTYYILRSTYRMTDHIVAYWTQFRRDKKRP